MKNALIGYSGFVGSTLLKQATFEYLFRSNNISEIANNHFDLVVCAAAPAQKWWANANPEQDLKNIQNLMHHLSTLKCKKFILISTVDVFKAPTNVNEHSPVNEEDLHPYGLHRRLLEKHVEKSFLNPLILRLPGLVGPGLKKNIIFDFLNNNDLNKIDSRGEFQFYPMVNLWSDIQTALSNNISLIHLTSEPISVEEIAIQAFRHNEFSQNVIDRPAKYNMESIYGDQFNSLSPYQYSKKEVLLAIRAYAQSEPISKL